jgi:hypothetical protein
MVRRRRELGCRFVTRDARSPLPATKRSLGLWLARADPSPPGKVFAAVVSAIDQWAAVVSTLHVESAQADLS